MAKLYNKREEALAGTSTVAYLPTQPIDYTSLPVVEEQGPLARIATLPTAVKSRALLVFLIAVAVLVWALFLNKPAKSVPLPPAPVAKITDATVTGEASITLDAMIANLTKPVSATAQLLAAGQPIAWAEPKTAIGTVGTNGKLEMRLTRVSTWQQPLDKNAAYTVRVNVPGAKDVMTNLDIPATVAADFYAGGVVAAVPTPMPAPTVVPTPVPSPQPTAVSGPIAKANASLLISPTLGSRVLLALPDAVKLAPIFRTDDNRFFLVKQNNQVGWLSADQLTITSQDTQKIKSIKPEAGASDAGPLTAKVFNGGNIRYRPSKETGTVLGQMIAGQTITLKEKLATGQWYYVIAPNAEGWVARDLLTISPQAIAAVPLTNQ